MYESSNSGESGGSKSGGSDGSGNNDGNGGASNNGNASTGGNGNVDFVSSTTANGAAQKATGATGGATQPSAQAASQPAVTKLSADDVQIVSKGRWSMIQAINRHPANIDELMFTNPFAPFVAPLAAGVFFAGGVEAVAGFCWQRRRPKVPVVQA